MKVGAISFLFGAVIAAGVAFLAGIAWATRTLSNLPEVKATLTVGAVGAGIAVVAAIISIWGVYSQRVLTRRQATIAHLAALAGDRSVNDTIQEFIRISREPNIARFAEEDQQGSDDTLAITAVLNQFELISVGIQRGIFEYELIKTWQAGSIIRYWNAAHPFVVALRNRVGVPKIWREFELLNNWVSGTEKPRKTLWWTGLG